MDISVLQELDKMDLSTARAAALELLDPKKTKKLVMQRLTLDLEKAPTPAEVSRIMWQCYLSGNGMATIGSAWKKKYY